MKVIYIEWLPDEIRENLNKEEFVYKDSEETYYLMTDKTYVQIEDKYSISKLEDEGDTLCYVYKNIKDWMDTHYEQKYYKFMGEEINLSDFSESVYLALLSIVNDNEEEITFVNSDNWIKDFEKYLYSEVSIYLSGELIASLIEGKELGLDINLLKAAFNNL